MDEQPKQLIGEKYIPQVLKPGQPQRFDCEYVREGVCTIWMFVEALGQWRTVWVSERRTAIDWAKQVQQLVNHPRYAQAKLITLVCDNLNTHTPASFYQAFKPPEALRLSKKIALVYTPKHGSWLNIAEPELSVLSRQCLDRRIEQLTTIEQEVTQWAHERNQRQVGVNWQFATDDARIKLKHLYPEIQE